MTFRVPAALRPALHHALALLAYTVIALLFVWPLPLHIRDALLGPPAGDLGVYVWNVWVFRHELIAHQQFPLFTSEILALTPPAPLTLQNYTIFANLVSMPLQPLVGVVGAFNLITIGSAVLNAYAMFVYARLRTGDAFAGWVGGLVFGFSAFMAARQTVHFSLLLAAPLPIFALLMHRIALAPSRRLAAWAGVVVAWAYLCDPYYAVYCLMILGFMTCYSLVSLDFRPGPLRRSWWTTLLELALFCMTALIVAVWATGGGRLDVAGVRVSLMTLYTPVLLLLLLTSVRLVLIIRPYMRIRSFAFPVLPLASIGIVVLVLCMVPVLYAMATPLGSPLGSPLASAVPVPWRNSAPGLDLGAYLVPNPMHPWLSGISANWIARQPNGFEENVSSIPWVAVLAIAAAAALTHHRPHYGWLAFTTAFAALSLGPFMRIAGFMTYVPTPWAVLRYVPIVGGARMPTRITVVVTLGVAMLLAMAVRHLRSVRPQQRMVPAMITALLILELVPAPRPLHSVRIPEIFRIVAADPRSVRVLHLPFGLRDGLGSRGNGSAQYQFFQIFHEKPLIGGYLSRLPRGEVERYDALPVISALFDLSEHKALDSARRSASIADGQKRNSWLKIGWVVVDSSTASPELVSFAHEALHLTLVASDGVWDLYRSPGLR